MSWRTGLVAMCVALAACIGSSGSKPLPGDEPEVTCETADVGAPVLRRLSSVELDSTLRDVFDLDDSWLGVRLGADPVSPDGFTNGAEMLFVGGQTAEDLLQTGEDVADLLLASGKLPSVIAACSDLSSDACAQDAIAHYGRRLFRRTITAPEQADYLKLYQDTRADADGKTGLKWTLVALIQSPRAVYRSEIGVKNGKQYNLTQHEIATELAYTFTGTTPSEDLLAKADQGLLGTKEAVLSEARKLLATPAGRGALHRLLREWIGYHRVQGQARAKVPDFQTYGTLMVEETRRFLEHVLLEQEGSVADLLLSPDTFINDQLAELYGFGSAGASFAKVTRPEGRGVGLLAHGSVLAGYSHMDATSPTLRGLFVFRRLLCREIGPPPADVPPVPPPEPGTYTTRQLYEEQHAQGSCKFCHEKFDPAGFAMEHFDEAGRYRADDNGLTIDDSGSAPFDQGEQAVDGLVGLAKALADSPATTTCVSELFASYAFGGSERSECSIDAPQAGLVAGDYGLVEYLLRLSTTPHFFYRQ